MTDAIRAGGDAFLRDFKIAGVPASGEQEPVKAEGRAAFAAISDALANLGVNGAITVKKATRTSLLSDLAHGADTLAIVYADANPTYNGVYAKAGASGTGAWAITSIPVAGAIAAGLTRTQTLVASTWLDSGVLTGELSAGEGWTAAREAVAYAIKSVVVRNAEPGERYFIAAFQNYDEGEADAIIIRRGSDGQFAGAFGGVITKRSVGLTEVIIPPSVVVGSAVEVTLFVDYGDLADFTGPLFSTSTPGPLWIRPSREADMVVERLRDLETPAWTGFIDADGDVAAIADNVETDPDSEPVKIASTEGTVTGLSQAGDLIRWVDLGGPTPFVRSFDVDGLHQLPAGITKVVFVPMLGQSLLTGTGGYPIITTSSPAPGKAFMFNGGVRVVQGLIWNNVTIRRLDDAQIQALVPLYETLPSNGLDYGETQGGGLAYWMGRDGVLEDGAAIVPATVAFGGTSIAASAPGTVPYQNVIRTIERLNALCRMTGIELEVPVLFWDQGEADAAAGTSAATYKAALTALQAAFTTDVNAILGGSGQRPLLIRQPSSFTKFGATRDPLMYAFVDHAIANPTKFKLAGPQYANQGYGADGVHMGAVGYRFEGEMAGRALALLRDGVATGGLFATTASNSGTTITLTFNSTSQLAIDTTLVSDPGQRGLTLVAPDEVTTIALSSIAVVGSNQITATAGSALTAGQTYTVEIAGRGANGASAGPTTGPRSNIRDSSLDESSAAVQGLKPTQARLYNWAHHQRITFVAS